MKSNWKKLLFPGLGGLLIGVTAVALGRKFQQGRAEFQPLSGIGESLDLLFEPEKLGVGQLFRCRQTPFKVWSLIGGTLDAPGSGGQSRVYHVQIRELGESPSTLRESLYATLHGVTPDGKRTRAGQVALDCAVELRECRVGGAVNGVETGRRFRSSGVLKAIDTGHQPIVAAQDSQKT